MKRILDFIKTNTAMKVFSLILAILLWAYVQIAQNPEVVYEIVEVPITITGEADINSSGFVVSVLPKNMKTNVTISAARSKIQTLDTSDLFAFVDVSQCNDKGDFSLPIKVRSNDSEITVMNKNPSSISLYIDKIITVTKPISISYDGTLDTDYYIDKDNIKITPENATIKVPELLAENISEVLVSVDMTGVDATVKNSYEGIAVSENGEEIYSENLSFVTEKIDVEIPVLKKKTVPIKIDNAPDGVEFTLNADEVEIAGAEKNLSTVTEIMGYINNYDPEKPQTSYSVTLKIPDGFVAVDKEEKIAYPKKNQSENDENDENEKNTDSGEKKNKKSGEDE